MKNRNQSGFHVVELAVVLVILGVIGFVGYTVFASKKDGHSSKENVISKILNSDNKNGAGELARDCKGSGTVQLQHSPLDLKDVGSVTPIGLLAGAHVTPIDHLYFYPKDMTNRDAAPVYAMADGYIVSYSERTQNTDTGTAKKGEYQLYFQHNCSFYTYFDLMTSMEPSLAKQIKDQGGKDLHIPVKAGQVVGRVGAQSLDTAVYNFDITLKGFLNPDSYKQESVKLHTDDFFKYWNEPLKGQLLAMNIRKFEPYGGKIDYDIDGRLIGNWFEEGTNGYAGRENKQGVAGSDGQGYWSTHLAIVPDAVTQNQIDISLGDYQGKATQFSAKTGSPDPATIGKDKGLVKYEFVQYGQPGFSPTGTTGAQSQQVRGTVLFQLTDTRKLKMEAFPGKTAEHVTGFSSGAKTYVR